MSARPAPPRSDCVRDTKPSQPASGGGAVLLRSDTSKPTPLGANGLHNRGPWILSYRSAAAAPHRLARADRIRGPDARAATAKAVRSSGLRRHCMERALSSRVAIVTPRSALGAVGGAERFYVGLRNALRGAGVETVVVEDTCDEDN